MLVVVQLYFIYLSNNWFIPTFFSIAGMTIYLILSIWKTDNINRIVYFFIGAFV